MAEILSVVICVLVALLAHGHSLPPWCMSLWCPLGVPLVRRSQGLEMPAGALHWLPTELPAGVRFIVSTIATTDKGKPSKPHRTYLELLRR